MIIREGVPSDIPALVSIFTNAVHRLAAPHYTEKQRLAWAPETPNLDEWAQRLRSVRTLVADYSGCLAGFVGFDSDGHIDLLHTAPGFERQGIASSLLREAEHVLIQAGVSRYYTEASLVARSVFERAGYFVESEEAVHLRGELFRRFRMSKGRSDIIQQGIQADTPASGAHSA